MATKTSLIQRSIDQSGGILNTTSGIVELRMRVIARAPCRVDLAGGTLDIWPLYLFHPGAVTVNFAINRYTRCAIETLDSPAIRLRSDDLKAAEDFGSLAELDQAARPRLPLAAHLLRFFRPSTGLSQCRRIRKLPRARALPGHRP